MGVCRKSIRVDKNKNKKSMKKLLVFFLVLLSSITYSQTFNGIYVGQTYHKTDSLLKTIGFRLDNSLNIQKPDIKTYIGELNGEKTNVFLVLTKTNKMVWKLVVDVKENYDWYNTKKDYLAYKEILLEKYGIPKSEYSFFSTPYYDGDGYEMSAIYLNKCNYLSGWGNDDYTVSLSIISYKKNVSTIRISYENTKIINIEKDIEKNKNLKTF
jgi:hypothetical protein